MQEYSPDTKIERSKNGMKELIPGFIVTIGGVIIGGILYKMGYNKGVSECRRIVQTAVEVHKAVEEK